LGGPVRTAPKEANQHQLVGFFFEGNSGALHTLFVSLIIR